VVIQRIGQNDHGREMGAGEEVPGLGIKEVRPCRMLGGIAQNEWVVEEPKIVHKGVMVEEEKKTPQTDGGYGYFMCSAHD